MTQRMTFIFAALCMTFSANAWANPIVTFNGIDVTGLQNQTFHNVTIEFDANGNINLTAPQYKLVQTSPQPTQTQNTGTLPNTPAPAAIAPAPAAIAPAPAAIAPAPAAIAPAPTAAPSLTNLPVLPDNGQPTYLIAMFDAPGLLGHNVDLYINGTFVKTLDQGKAQQTLDITQYLVKGKNTLQYRLIMAADSGSSSRANVNISLAKMTNKKDNAIELSGQYADIHIKGADGAKTYTVDFNLQ